jgi:hypothetical protein
MSERGGVAEAFNAMLERLEESLPAFRASPRTSRTGYGRRCVYAASEVALARTRGTEEYRDPQDRAWKIRALTELIDACCFGGRTPGGQ